MDRRIDAKRVIVDGYERIGGAFSRWNSQLPQEGRRWFLAEILARLPERSCVLELGCGPATDAPALATRRRYVGIDLSLVQLAIARRRAPNAKFVAADLTSPPFQPASFDGVVAFYAFNHVPRREVQPTFANILEVLRPGGWLMLAALPTAKAEDRVEEWLGVPMFFAGVEATMYDPPLRHVGFKIEMSEVRFPTHEWWEFERVPMDHRAKAVMRIGLKTYAFDGKRHSRRTADSLVFQHVATLATVS